MNKEYLEQAEKFLADTATTLEIVKAVPQKSPLWSKKGKKHGINYCITLKNKNGTYTFDFWDSIRDSDIINAIEKLSFSQSSASIQAERLLDNEGVKYQGIGIKYSKEKKALLIKQYEPSAYDILACLSLLYEDTFEDFCSAFGYDSDSITALKTFEACKEQDRNIRKLWGRSEIDILTKIQ